MAAFFWGLSRLREPVFFFFFLASCFLAEVKEITSNQAAFSPSLLHFPLNIGSFLSEASSRLSEN